MSLWAKTEVSLIFDLLSWIQICCNFLDLSYSFPLIRLLSCCTQGFLLSFNNIRVGAPAPPIP